jgi:hypothetical protein
LNDPSRPVLQPPAPERHTQWLALPQPCPLLRLFGSKIPQPPERALRKAFSQEELLIQLLAAEHSDEELDDRELEGLGDVYEENE